MRDSYAAAEIAWSRYDEAEGNAIVQCELEQERRDEQLGVRPWFVAAATKHGPEHYEIHASSRELARASAVAVGQVRFGAEFVTVDTLTDSARTVAQEWFRVAVWCKDGLHIVDVADYRRGFKQLVFGDQQLRDWVRAGIPGDWCLDPAETAVAQQAIDEYMAGLEERQVA